MAKLMHADMFATNPQRPQPITLAYRMTVTQREIEMARVMPPGEMKKMIRQQMASALGKEIAEKCAPFEVPERLYPGQTLVQMEVTLHDRGAYEHWLPHERRTGEERGKEIQRIRDELRTPYGFEPESFYE